MIRVRVPELMDDPAVDAAEHDRALRALNRVNAAFGVNRGLARVIERFGPLNRLSVLDVGAGGGGFLMHLQRRAGARSAGRLIGVDRSPHAAALARRWTPREVLFVASDARNLALADASVDVAACSLLLHHVDEADAAAMLAEMGRVARLGVVLGDLSRSRVAWALTWAVTHLVSRSPLVRVDGPRSVRAAYVASELRALAERGGLHGASVRGVFPFRLLLMWRKSGEALR